VFKTLERARDCARHLAGTNLMRPVQATNSGQSRNQILSFMRQLVVRGDLTSDWF